MIGFYFLVEEYSKEPISLWFKDLESDIIDKDLQLVLTSFNNEEWLVSAMSILEEYAMKDYTSKEQTTMQ